MSDFINNILKDLKVDLTEAFDRNFERKAFFSGAPWKPTKRPVSRGSLLVRSSAMRNSIKSEIKAESLVFSSSKPYTAIHNEGGTINMPPRKQILHFDRKGRFSKNNKRASYGQKANVRGYSVNIPQRQFIGDAPEVNKIIREVATENVSEAIKRLFSNRK
ncbi:phage virion morphogenesis protein [Dysgonomonas sp. Marseille-P4361]|uniref:phage virion morphogenesis protein n=1 Tax=Dysgonomonas sp. Marseille-P4361 TaxID=2161820 RepID=UPI000D5602EA|nr:phage virion morphogenesis protein [Dysgonomonas sp. Marseille-P4361]